jgi:hypothetical protein
MDMKSVDLARPPFWEKCESQFSFFVLRFSSVDEKAGEGSVQ